MVEQLSVEELKERLDRDGGQPVILDVREPWELGVCALENTVHIPMRQIPVNIEALDKDQEIVVMCHHGIRSQSVARFLEQNGFDKIYNLSGGIDAWAKRIDSSMAVY